jgi:hypothetical protein
MPRRIKIIAGRYKGRYLLARNPGEKIYCEQCRHKMAIAKYPDGRWLCRRCAFNSPEGQRAMESIKRSIKGG